MFLEAYMVLDVVLKHYSAITVKRRYYGDDLIFNGEYSLIIVIKVTYSIIGMKRTSFNSSLICQLSCLCGTIFMF